MATKQQTVYEGRRTRQNRTTSAVNDLNANDPKWHYAIAEITPNALEDSVSMLERDGYETVPTEDAEKLGFRQSPSSKLRLMRIDKGQWQAYQDESVELAKVNSRVRSEETEAHGVNFASPTDENRVVTISDPDEKTRSGVVSTGSRS